MGERRAVDLDQVRPRLVEQGQLGVGEILPAPAEGDADVVRGETWTTNATW